MSDNKEYTVEDEIRNTRRELKLARARANRAVLIGKFALETSIVSALKARLERALEIRERSKA